MDFFYGVDISVSLDFLLQYQKLYITYLTECSRVRKRAAITLESKIINFIL